MSKFSKASEEIQNLVAQVAEQYGLDQVLDFEAVHCAKAKEVVSVCKASAVAEYLGNRENLILFIIREDAFDRTDEKNKLMWLRMAMSQVNFDFEKDKVSIGNPSITLSMEFLDFYKEEAINSAKLAKYTMSQLEEEEKERKEAEKAAKKSRKKQ